MDVCECRQMFADVVSITLADPIVQEGESCGCAGRRSCVVDFTLSKGVFPTAQNNSFVQLES